MTIYNDPISPDVYDIAFKTMRILPLILRFMSAEMRGGNEKVEAGHMATMGMLDFRPHTLSELAVKHSVSLPTMSSNISTLEARGWVHRRRSEEDRRLVWIELTEAGSTVLDESQREAAKRMAAVLNSIEPEKRAILNEGLTAMVDAFDQYLTRTIATG